jgi:integrase/recombinase XerD
MLETSMNRRPPVFKLTKATTGFLQYKTAKGLSPRRIEIYVDHLKNWAHYSGDPLVHNSRPDDVRACLAWLATEYKPARFAKAGQPLSAKSVHNVCISLSAFHPWASDEFQLPNPMKGVAAPKLEEKPFEPYTEEEVETLLKACDYCQEARTQDRRKFAMRRPTANRDRALIVTLLDTELRASELCALTIGDVNQKTGRVEVKHGVQGGTKGGKGRKGRVVYLGKSARRTLWRYLAGREDGDDATAPLFLGRMHRPMNKGALRSLIAGLGEKAKVNHCHPHLFRHTFALTYLQSGGDVFALQSLLGHSTLEMVQRYARIAQVDVEDAHRKASPADNWHL